MLPKQRIKNQRIVNCPLRKNHMKKPTCESRVKLEQHFTCDPHVVKTHVIHMWSTCGTHVTLQWVIFNNHMCLTCELTTCG